MSIRSQAELQAALVEAQSAYSQAEQDFREQRFLTDDELRERIRDKASAEKDYIRRAVEAGLTFIVAGGESRRVHFYHCSTLRDQVDRDHAWSFWMNISLEEYRQAVAHGDGGPRMPELLDREAVEALSTYVTCQICSPTLSHTRKSRGERTTKLTSLTARHMGRSLSALDGTPLGVLTKIITTVEARGTTLQVETTTHSFTAAEHTSVLVVPIHS